VPDYLARQARAAAEREQVPIDQMVALALSAQLAAWRGSDDMETRAKRANRAKNATKLFTYIIDLQQLANNAKVFLQKTVDIFVSIDTFTA
jgi:hypothetical protein